jgi:hypothetical protein
LGFKTVRMAGESNVLFKRLALFLSIFVTLTPTAEERKRAWRAISRFLRGNAATLLHVVYKGVRMSSYCLSAATFQQRHAASVVELLLRCGADPNDRSGVGCTALQHAALRQSDPLEPEVLELLLEAGADPDASCAALAYGGKFLYCLQFSVSNVEVLPSEHCDFEALKANPRKFANLQCLAARAVRTLGVDYYGPALKAKGLKRFSFKTAPKPDRSPASLDILLWFDGDDDAVVSDES